MRRRHRKIRRDGGCVLVVMPFPVFALGAELATSLAPVATATPVLSVEEFLLEVMLVFL
jgi:hypothetical protein